VRGNHGGTWGTFGELMEAWESVRGNHGGTLGEVMEAWTSVK
jgi:hypothetical protein